MKGSLFEVPGRFVTHVNVLDDADRNPKLTAYSTKLEKMWSIDLPGTDNPDATAYNELARNYFGVAATIAGATFVQWHDGSEWYESGDYGVARIEDGQVENVLINERQEETTVLGVPCLTLRDNTERPITITEGTNRLVGRDPATVLAAARAVLADPPQPRRPALWDGKAGERVAAALLDHPCPPRPTDLVDRSLELRT